MTYEQALAYIHDTYKFGAKLGLENIRALLAELGSPQDDLEFIHIAGTNGKGSTASLISGVLMQAGYRVGTFVSPFLEQFNERIQLNRMPIGNGDLAALTGRLKGAVDAMIAKGHDHPTEFECVTALGMLYFKDQKVDVVVLEVGMGGRLDSTNVIAPPLATVITPISMDHVAYLGDTLEKIAYEKAGIIKTGSPVVCVNQTQEALEVIKRVSQEKQTTLKIVNHELAVIASMTLEGTRFTYKEKNYDIGLLGGHQVQNACLAIEVLNLLRDQASVTFTDDHLYQGLKASVWMGRFEIVHHNPMVIIDGAHNEDGVKTLVEAITTYQPKGDRVAIFGMMADKAVDEVIKAVMPLFDTFYLVQPNNPRAMTTKDLEVKLLDHGYKGAIKAIKDIKEVNDLVRTYRDTQTVIYSFGSLYYIGEVRKLLNNPF